MIEYLSEPFIWRALSAALLAALITAPLGCFVIWQRMAYFGDALSHGALLGVALGLFIGVSINVSVLFVCAFFAVLLVLMQRHRILKKELSVDSRLGIVAHAGLAGALVLLAFIDDVRFDLEAYLFGDVLTVGIADLIRMLLVTLIVFVSMLWLWRPLLLTTISEDIARVEQVAVDRVRLLFILLLALVVATTIQIVGVLLTAALLVLPAASARMVSRTPEQMLLLTIVVGVLSVLGGILSSLAWDLPSGPAIILMATVVFLIVQGISPFLQNR